MFDLRVWLDTEADGSSATKTPGKGKDLNKNQMQRLAKLSKKHRNGQIPTVDWLDRLTFREIEMINEKEKNQSDYLYLLIEFQTVIIGEHTVSDFINVFLLFIYYTFFSSMLLHIMNLMVIKNIHIFVNRN